MREAKESLESVTTSLEILQEGTGRLWNSLQSERASLSNTLNDPACSNGDVTHTCNTIRGTLSQLALSANFHGVTLIHNPYILYMCVSGYIGNLIVQWLNQTNMELNGMVKNLKCVEEQYVGLCGFIVTPVSTNSWLMLRHLWPIWMLCLKQTSAILYRRLDGSIFIMHSL